MTKTVPFLHLNESFATDLLVGYFYSFTERLLQLQTEQPHCPKIFIIRTSMTMFEEILPVKKTILSSLTPYFQ